MTKIPLACVVVLGAAAALAGCRNTADMQAQLVAQWKAHCAAQGKQFVWKDTSTSNDLLTVQVQVDGKCVGPGEHGYLPPEPPDEGP